MALQTLVDLFEDRVAESGDDVAVRYKNGGVWRMLSWTQWLRDSTVIAAGLIELGVARGDRVAILSRTRVDWVLADIAIQIAGACSVPIYHSQLGRQCKWLLANSGACVVFAEDPEQVSKLLDVFEELPNLKKIIYFDAATQRLSSVSGPRSLNIEQLDTDAAGPNAVLDLDTLRELGAGAIAKDHNVVRERRRQRAATDMLSLVYTSGTTGRPRGVVLTDENFVSEVLSCAVAVPLDRHDVQLMFLPLAHIFARILYLTSIKTGSETVFGDGPHTLFDDLAEVQPTFFAAVPSVYERIYSRFISTSMVSMDGTNSARTGAKGGNAAPEEVSSSKGLRGIMAKGALRSRATVEMVELARRKSAADCEGGKLSFRDRALYAVADAALYRRLRAVFGGRLKFCLSGGAALPQTLAQVFHGAGVLILEGYGMTENCGAATFNRPQDFRLGTVGRPMPGVELRIAPDGEVMIKGSNVMAEYWQDPEATAAAIVDGWLLTGDVGSLDGPFLRITDRKKNLIVTANGKNIAPQPIEERLQRIPLIDRAVVHGDGRAYLTALLTLDAEAAEIWAEDNDISVATVAELAVHPQLFDAVRRAVDVANREWPAEEGIRRFAILDAAFELDAGELTPMLKMRRNYITEKYRSILDGFYEE